MTRLGIFTCVTSFFLMVQFPAHATNDEAEKKEQTVSSTSSTPIADELDSNLFETEFREYVKTTVACDSVVMTEWLEKLSPRERMHFRALYGKLRPEKGISKTHQLLLNNCLFECYNSFALHDSSFGKELLDMMDGMGHEVSCQFFLDLCGMFSIKELERNWFPLIIDLFKVLPTKERNLTSLTELGSILHVERDDQNRLYHFRPEGSNQRLFLLRTALLDGEVLDMDGVRALMKVRPSQWQYVRERLPELAAVTITSVLSTALICFNLF